MACRIQNLTSHRLAIDTRGGGVVYVEPFQTSRALREELLYGNIHLPQWMDEGLVRWIDARMADVLAEEQGTAEANTPEVQDEGSDAGADAERGEDAAAAKSAKRKARTK